MADKAHILTDKEIEKMERHLSAIYSRAEKELSEKADKYFKRFRKRDEKMRELLDAGEIDRKEYDAWRKNQLMTGRHWTEMKRQAAHRLTQADQEAADYINGRLPSVYALNYNAVSDGLETQLKGYSFELVDANTVRNLATQDKTLLPYKYIDGAKAERWHTQRVNAEVLQGILQGESIPKIAKRLRDNVGMSARGSAVRNARTAVTSAENKGRMDMLHDAEEKGVKAEKGWLAAHDARVRESHAQVDGEFVGIDDEFSNGLQFPGDPDGAPEEVYNCRCTLVYRVGGVKSAIEEAEEVSFVPATSIEEAETFISQFVDTSIFGATGVDYTGVDLEAANEVNRVLSHLQKTFDVGKFGGITAPAGNTKAGKMISGAQAAYSPIRKSYYLNRKTFKSVSAAEKAFKAETKAIMDILEHPERYDFSKASSALLRVIENSKISGRATIPTTIEQCLQHEFGHSLEKRVMSHELWGSALENMAEFAPKISGYACQDKSEYIAESFCSYMQGEKRADPVLVKIFESLKR